MTLLKYFGLISGIIISQLGCSQTNQSNCACDGILIPIQQNIVLYDYPNGKTISEIKNDSLTENYYSISIMEIQKEWSKVSANSPQDTGKVGWIKTEYLGIYTRNYSEPLNLYEVPVKGSKIKFTIKEWSPTAWNILNCKDKWLYVTYTSKKGKYKGWLEPDMQCANPYTTCP